MTTSPDITILLEAVNRGDAEAEAKVMELVHDELRRLAQRRFVRRTPGDSLPATALVNEVYLRLFGDDRVPLRSRRHLFFVAARSMRDVAVEHARRNQARKRGGDRERLAIDADELPAPERTAARVLDVHVALDALRDHDPVCADVVLLRFFGAMTHDQVAATLEMSEARVRRQWAYARAWLREHMADEPR